MNALIIGLPTEDVTLCHPADSYGPIFYVGKFHEAQPNQRGVIRIDARRPKLLQLYSHFPMDEFSLPGFNLLVHRDDTTNCTVWFIYHIGSDYFRVVQLSRPVMRMTTDQEELLERCKYRIVQRIRKDISDMSVPMKRRLLSPLYTGFQFLVREVHLAVRDVDPRRRISITQQLFTCENIVRHIATFF